MAKFHGKLKGRRDHDSYSGWPHVCARHPNFLKLSVHAKALLFFFLGQYRGKNNGDLSCAWGLVSDASIGSRNTVEKARAELEQTGWIVRTRQGSVNRCCLYALTFREIDECQGKLDEKPGPALGFWKDGANPWLSRQTTTRPKRSGIFSKRSRCATLAHHVGNPCSPPGHQSPTLPTTCAYLAPNDAGPTPPVEHLSTSTKRSAAESAGASDVSGGVETQAGPSVTIRKTRVTVRDAAAAVRQ